MTQPPNCDHWWNTIEELGYGYVSICEHCGKRESAEHSQTCFDRMFGYGLDCNCGAAEEFEKYEAEPQKESKP